jgi:DNA end-binding protein Ku
MSRVLWKGDITFGLLHTQVSLYAATQRDEIDFDWLKRDTLQPIGYKRVVKETGEEIDKEEIVKGVKQEDGSYVVLSDREIQTANPVSTHTIDIVSFVNAHDIPSFYFDTPYFIVPNKGEESVYVLLREALLESNKIGIGLFVLHNKQHLAALVPTRHGIILDTLRWAAELKDEREFDFPSVGYQAGSFKSKELAMATQLVESMSDRWDSSQFKDTFNDEIMKLVRRKIREGKAETVESPKIEMERDEHIEQIETETGGETNLAELLERSLQNTGKTKSQKTRSGVSAKRPLPLGQKNATPRGRGSKTAH